MRWANAERTGIDMIITISGQRLPFTARADDPESYGRELFQKAVSGEFGEIGEYQPPILEPEVEKIQLTDEQINHIAEKAAEVAFRKIYEQVGKSVVHKIYWLVGAGVIALMYWLAGNGNLKN
jgi:hypothetical protein